MAVSPPFGHHVYMMQLFVIISRQFLSYMQLHACKIGDPNIKGYTLRNDFVRMKSYVKPDKIMTAWSASEIEPSCVSQITYQIRFSCSWTF